MSSPKRLYGLDGLRAISILMVMASHVAGSALLGGGHIPLGRAHAWGKVGVRVFFVISGLLITKLLLDERDKHGGISIKAFYVRRAFRILPAFLVYIAAISIMSWFGAATLPLDDVVHALTYTTNFDVERSWLVSHIWSLSVEEQFYLFWPLAFGLLPRRAAFWVAFATCVISPFARLFVLRMLPTELDSLVWQAAPAVADSLATGCLVAFLRHDDARAELGAVGQLLSRLLAFTRGTALTYLLFPAAFFTYLLETRPTIWCLIAVSFSNVAFALVIDRTISTQSDVIGRGLLHPWLERIGVLSYSIYLWQQLFLRQSLVREPVWSVLCSVPLSVALAMIAGALSYYLIERPILRRRPRWADR